MPDTAWTLPEGIESPPPARVARLERLRRQLLDLYVSWGYLQTSPPFMEHAAALRSDDEALNRNLFELSDALSEGRLAIRADATTQVARMQAVQMDSSRGPVRLCYCLPVAQRQPESLGAPRFFYQLGVELFGSSAASADAEVLGLMIQSLQQAGVTGITVNIGHTVFFSAIMGAAGVQGDGRQRLLQLLQNRAAPEIPEAAAAAGVGEAEAQLLVRLADSHGDMTDLESVAQPFMHLPQIAEAVSEVRTLSAVVPSDCRVQFDFADLHGRMYHQGLVFACFTPAHGAAVARGGRYRAGAEGDKPAVGFSSSLWLLEALGREASSGGGRVIFAPADDDSGLAAEVARLRAAGEVVVCGLDDSHTAESIEGCTHALCRSGDGWQVRAQHAKDTAKDTAKNNRSEPK